MIHFKSKEKSAHPELVARNSKLATVSSASAKSRNRAISPMRLLFLNRSFWPDLEATGQLLTELCTDLSRDHEVSVIAGPSYHVDTRGRGLWRQDMLGRVRVTRTWGTRLPKRRLLGRLLNLGSYYALAAVAALRSARPDVVVAETDPPLLGLLAVLLRARWHCRFVYYCQDIYPDIAEVTGGIRNRPLLALLRWAIRLAYRKADLIVVLGEDIRRRLIDKGVPAARIAVVPNWVDCNVIHPLSQNGFRTQFGNRFVVMYSGNLGLSQQLKSVLEAARRLRDDDGLVFAALARGSDHAKRLQSLIFGSETTRISHSSGLFRRGKKSSRSIVRAKKAPSRMQ
ncbi:MAG: glycosyltransferase family 4 protein [Candidatus Binatia bacterium]